MGGKVKNENVKVEKKDGSHYYIANMDLKKLDFVDNTINFLSDAKNCPTVFSIEYDSGGGYGKKIYIVSNDCNDEVIILHSLAKVKEFIARNILDLD